MIKVFIVSIFMFCALSCLSEEQTLFETDIKKILNKPENAKFSGVVFVSVGGEKVINLGVGLADIDGSIPFSDKTLVPIGSITKQFTAAAILKLEAQGKLSTKDKAHRYIPSLEGKLKEITIHQLLTHTAGITSETGPDDASFTSKDLLDHLNKIQLSYPMGTHQYSNLGYSLLGLIVERLTDKPIDQFLAKSLFEPIGMLKTGYTHPAYKDTEASRGYVNGKDWGYLHKKNWQKTGPYWNLRGNGGMYSTVEDMHKWHTALHFGNYFSENAKAKLFGMHVREFEAEESYYGYGWVTEILPKGNKVIWHNGGNGIFSADVRYYPSLKIYYFIAGNRSDAEVYDISDDIHNLIMRKGGSKVN